jgi:hypothetical protein
MSPVERRRSSDAHLVRPDGGDRRARGLLPAVPGRVRRVDRSGRPAAPAVWRPFLERFEAIGPEGREAVGRTTEQKLLESGIAFNVHADPDDRQAAWRLDLLPVILDAAAWHELESGLIQRARLIEAVLQDLYGPQRLLRSGVLPPSLVFGNPEFLHACSGWPEPPKRFLHVYACDVARDPDGGWRVLADQIDAPAGNGWLLASRVALSQGLGELYLESGVRRVASYYARLQAGLQAAAPARTGGSSCSRPVRTTRASSATPISPAISAMPWSSQPISPSATASSTSRRWRACSGSISSCARSPGASPIP